MQKAASFKVSPHHGIASKCLTTSSDTSAGRVDRAILRQGCARNEKQDETPDEAGSESTYMNSIACPPEWPLHILPTRILGSGNFSRDRTNSTIRKPQPTFQHAKGVPRRSAKQQKVDRRSSSRIRVSCNGVISRRQLRVEMSLQNCFPQGSFPLLRAW